MTTTTLQPGAHGTIPATIPGTADALWLYDALAVIEALEGKDRLDLWQDVVAALRLLDAAARAVGTAEAELLVAAMERVSAARCALPDELGTPSLLLPAARRPGHVDLARASLRDDATWLHQALQAPGEPPAHQVAAVLRSLADHVLAVLGR